jgi:hypothetical protein
LAQERRELVRGQLCDDSSEHAPEAQDTRLLPPLCASLDPQDASGLADVREVDLDKTLVVLQLSLVVPSEGIGPRWGL